MRRAGFLDDTIVAAATPPGVAGVAIVRLSGTAVECIAERVLGDVPQPRRAVLRTFVDAQQAPVDRGIALYFPAPHSYTGEAVLELHAHGGPMTVSALIDEIIAMGARRAEPGEFSKRAFLNGKLDLLQAEAVADLVASGTQQAARAALRSLAGEFSERIQHLQEALTLLRLHVEAAIDFPEEEIDFLADRGLKDRVAGTERLFGELATGAEAGRLLCDGYQVVIAGQPNAGKSSLLNRFSGEESAIVTEVPGTTRDVLRERVNLDGLAVEFVDTAGLRESRDRIETEGMRRAMAALSAADAALWIHDASVAEPADPAAFRLAPELPVLIVQNKIDLSGDEPGVRVDEPNVIYVSAKTGAGLDALTDRIKALAGYSDPGEGAFTARRRHIDALERARGHFTAGVHALERRRAGELFAEELRLAQQALGEITGEFSSDDLLGRIFAEFCIGK